MWNEYKFTNFSSFVLWRYFCGKRLLYKTKFALQPSETKWRLPRGHFTGRLETKKLFAFTENLFPVASEKRCFSPVFQIHHEVMNKCFPGATKWNNFGQRPCNLIKLSAGCIVDQWFRIILTFSFSLFLPQKFVFFILIFVFILFHTVSFFTSLTQISRLILIIIFFFASFCSIPSAAVCTISTPYHIKKLFTTISYDKQFLFNINAGQHIKKSICEKDCK